MFNNNSKIKRVEIIEQSEGIDEEENVINLVVGHMMGGFDGVAHAKLLNESQASTTTFKITYNNNKQKIITVEDGSPDYNYYIKFVD